MIFVFCMLSFKPTFSLSSFTFNKRLFSSSSLSVIRVMSSAYLRLLIFLPAILIPACASSSPVFLMTYSAYKLNKQVTICSLNALFPDLEPVHFSMYGANCCILIFIQVSKEASKLVWYSHFLKNFLPFVVIHTVKGYSIINEAEVDFFLQFSCFFYDQIKVVNLISGSSAFSKSSLYIWKFSVHVFKIHSLKACQHYLASM